MGIFAFFPILVSLCYFGIILGIVYVIHKWVNKLFILKQEQNDLLREIIKKMDNK
jgi:hypothetical protein